MKKNLVKKDYLTKIKEIQKHNKSYYDENKPSITDQAYDILKNEIFDSFFRFHLKSSFTFFMN